MKLKILLMAFLVTFLIFTATPIDIYGQGVELQPLLKTGSLFTTGNTTDFGFFAGGNINIYKDTAAGFATYTQMGYFYGDKDHAEAQRTVMFIVVEKNFPEFRGSFKPYIAIGTGNLGEIQEGSDDNNQTYLLDIGGIIYQKLGLGFGAWYTPELHEVFVFFNLNLTP